MSKPSDSLDLIPALDETEPPAPLGSAAAAEDLILPAPISLPNGHKSEQSAGRAATSEDLVLPAPISLGDSGTCASPAGDESSGGSSSGSLGLSADDLFADLPGEDLPASASPGQPPAAATTQTVAVPQDSVIASDGDLDNSAGATSEAALTGLAPFDEAVAEESASAEPWTQGDQARVEARIAYLEQSRNRLLEAYKRAGEEKTAARAFETAQKEGRALLAEASELIEALRARSTATEARQSLVDAYFRLQRAVEQQKGEETGLYEGVGKKNKKSKKELEAAAKLARRAQEATRGPREIGRPLKMILFLGLLVAARVALLVVEKKPVDLPKVDPIQQLPGNAGVIGSVEGQSKKTEGPVIQHLTLSQAPSGLVATVACNTDGIAKQRALRYTFTWFEDDQIVGLGAEPTLDAAKLKEGARYHVEVKATDGEGTVTAASPKLIYGKGKQKGK